MMRGASHATGRIPCGVRVFCSVVASSSWWRCLYGCFFGSKLVHQAAFVLRFVPRQFACGALSARRAKCVTACAERRACTKGLRPRVVGAFADVAAVGAVRVAAARVIVVRATVSCRRRCLVVVLCPVSLSAWVWRHGVLTAMLVRSMCRRVRARVRLRASLIMVSRLRVSLMMRSASVSASLMMVSSLAARVADGLVLCSRALVGALFQG